MQLADSENHPTITVPLTKGYAATIDASDESIVCGFKWSASEHKNKAKVVVRVYAVRQHRLQDGSKRQITMHQLIMGMPDCDVDHRDANDTLNNCRSNLRLASRTQNNGNGRKRSGTSSRHKGVFFHRSTGKWCAQICVSGAKRHLGLFAEESAAAVAYNTAAEIAFGKYARVNPV